MDKHKCTISNTHPLLLTSTCFDFFREHLQDVEYKYQEFNRSCVCKILQDVVHYKNSIKFLRYLCNHDKV